MKFALSFSGIVMLILVLGVGFWIGKTKPGLLSPVGIS